MFRNSPPKETSQEGSVGGLLRSFYSRAAGAGARAKGLDRESRSSYTMEEMMLRQVMIPSKENPTFSIPAEFYGTEVEVLVFPFHHNKTNQNSGSIKDLFAKHLYSFDNYKFNRDEANDYE